MSFRLQGLILIPVLIFHLGVHSQNLEFPSDALTMQSDRSGSRCDGNPKRTKQLMDELEKKVACKISLTHEECHTLFLAGAGTLGGAGAALAARRAMVGGYLNLDPKDVTCQDKPISVNIWNLFIPRAEAIFCALDGTKQKQRALKEYAEQALQDVQKKRLKKKAEVQAAFDAATKIQIADPEIYKKQLIAKAEEFLQYMKDHPLTEESLKGREDYVTSQLRKYMAEGNISGVSGEMRKLNERFYQESFAKNEEILKIKNNYIEAQTPKPPSAVETKVQQALKEVMTVMDNSDLRQQQAYEKIKSIIEKFPEAKNLDIEGILVRRGEIRGLSTDAHEFSRVLSRASGPNVKAVEMLQAVERLPITEIETPANAKSLAVLKEAFPEAKGFMVRMPSSGLWAKASLRGLVAGSSREIAEKAAKAAFTFFTKAAAASTSAGGEALLFMGFEKCENRLQDDTTNAQASLGLNYLSMDRKTCKAEVSINEKSIQFFKLNSMDRVKLVRANTELCKNMLDLAAQELMTEKFKMECISKSTFRVIHPSDKGRNHNVTIEGNRLTANFENFTQPLYSCHQFTQDMATAEVSNKSPKCTIYTESFTNGNLFDYAQAGKCCAGENSSYCDLMKVTAINSGGASLTPAEVTK